MSEVRWVLKDAQGGQVRATDPFSSREEAEAWMGGEWESLLEEGAESVVLMDGGDTVYEMGLREA